MKAAALAWPTEVTFHPVGEVSTMIDSPPSAMPRAKMRNRASRRVLPGGGGSAGCAAPRLRAAGAALGCGLWSAGC